MTRFKYFVVRVVLIVTALAGAVGLGACGNDMQQTKREVFLSVVHHKYPDTRNRPALDNAIVRLSHNVCRAMDNGSTAQDIVNAVVTNVSTPSQAREYGYIIGAGVQTWCPRYSDDFLNLGSSSL